MTTEADVNLGHGLRQAQSGGEVKFMIFILIFNFQLFILISNFQLFKTEINEQEIPCTD